MTAFTKTRPQECLSDLSLDRLVAEEGSEEARAHLDSCDDCSTRFETIKSEQAAFQQNAPPLKAPAEVVSIRRYAPAIGLAIAAALAMFVVLVPGTEPTTRKKGGPSLTFFVKHGDITQQGGPAGTVLAPKDSIRFKYTTDREYHLAILSIDPVGTVSVYYPVGGQTRLEKAGDHPLPLSTVLDETVGTEYIFALFCEGAVDLAAAKATVTKKGIDLPKCVTRKITFEKRGSS